MRPQMRVQPVADGVGLPVARELDAGHLPARVHAGIGAAGTVLDDKLTIACGSGAVRLVQVQRAGAKAMMADEFLRGIAVKAGAKVA